MIIAFCGKAGSGKDTAADYLVRDHGFVKVALADELKRICMRVFDFSYEQLWGPSEKRNEPDKRYLRYEIDPMCAAKEVGGDRVGVYRGTVDGRVFVPYPEGPQYLTPRFALQQLGTEWGRACYPDIWIDFAMRVAHKLMKKDYLPNEPVWKYRDTVGLYQEGGFDPHRTILPTGVVISDVRFLNEVQGLGARGAKNIRIRRPVAGLSGAAAQHKSETEQDSIPDSAFDFVIQNDETLDALFFKVKHVASTFMREEHDGENADAFAAALTESSPGNAIVVSHKMDFGSSSDIVAREQVDVMFDRAVPLVEPAIQLDDGNTLLPAESAAKKRMRALLESREEDVKAGRLMDYDPGQENVPPFRRRK